MSEEGSVPPKGDGIQKDETGKGESGKEAQEFESFIKRLSAGEIKVPTESQKKNGEEEEETPDSPIRNELKKKSRLSKTSLSNAQVEPVRTTAEEGETELSSDLQVKLFGRVGSDSQHTPNSSSTGKYKFSRNWDEPTSAEATPKSTATQREGGEDDDAVSIPTQPQLIGFRRNKENKKRKSAVSLLNKRSDTERRNRIRKPTTAALHELYFVTTDKKWILLNPHHTFRYCFDILVYVGIFYTLFAVPVAASFAEKAAAEDWKMWFVIRVVWELFLDIVFMADVAMEMNTAVYDVRAEGYILDQKIIRAAYYNSYFWVDLTSSVPLELLIWPYSVYHRGIVRLLKLLRRVRLRRIGRGAQIVIGRLQGHLLRLFKVLTEFIWLSHVIGCFFYGLARLEGLDESWVGEMDLVQSSILTKYLQSVFYALTLTTGIGNTPVPPNTDWETIFVLIAMVAGAGFWAFVMGIMFDIIGGMNRVQNTYEHHLDQLSYWMDHKRVPPELKDLVYRQYKYQHTMTRGINDNDIMSRLSPALQTRLRRFLCRDIVATVPIFKGAADRFVNAIVGYLKPRFVITGDIICSQHEIGNEMYIIARGRVEILKENERSILGRRRTLSSAHRVTVLEKGSFFGEISLISMAPRNATCRALSPCDLFCLTKPDFDHIMHDFPEERRKLNDVARQRALVTSKITLPITTDQTDEGSPGTGENDATTEEENEEGEGQGNEMQLIHEVPDDSHPVLKPVLSHGRAGGTTLPQLSHTVARLKLTNVEERKIDFLFSDLVVNLLLHDPASMTPVPTPRANPSTPR